MGGEWGWPDGGTDAGEADAWPDQQDPTAVADAAGSAPVTAPVAVPAAPAFSVTLGPLQTNSGTTPEGTMGAWIGVHITNTGPEIPDGALLIWFNAVSTAAASEHSANFAHPLGPLAVGQGHDASGALQLDPGTWTVNAAVRVVADDRLLSVADPVSVEIAGQVGHSHAADASVQHDVAVHIDTVTREGPLYRIHYTLTNNSTGAVPPGLRVSGSLTGQVHGNQAEQEYMLQTGLAPHGHSPHYLTLESQLLRDRLTATITLHVGGGEVSSGTAQVDTDDFGAVVSVTPV